MPSPLSRELTQRQQQLLLRSAALRDSWGLQAQQLEHHLHAPLKLADKLYLGLRWLRDNPLLAGAGLALLSVLRPRRAIGWLPRLLSAWGLYQKVRAWTAPKAP